MKPSFWIVICLISIALTNVGGCNAFNDLYDKNTDEAIVEDINKLIDARLWSDAVDKWYTLSATAQTSRTNLVLLANAYAGRGGLDTISLLNSLASGGGGNLFTMLMSSFTGATISDYNDEVTAANIMLNISATAAGRTTDENVFLLSVELAKLGTLVAATGDLDLDGTVDATYDNCALSSGQGDEVITAIGNISDILAVIGTGSTGGSLTALTNACASLGGACAVTLTSGVTPVMSQAGRTLVGESNLGVGLAAPYNDPYCQLSNAPIDPTVSVPPLSCPGGLVMGSGPICP